MPAFLILLFVIVPLVELAIVIQIGQVIGVGWTLLLLIADSVLGAVLLRREGRRAWTDFRNAITDGRWPGDEVTQGALVIVGGTLLLTPGFLTDLVGLLLLIPVSRALTSRIIRRRLTPPPVKIYQGLRGSRQSAGSGPARGPRGEVLDVEVVDIRRDEPPTHGGTATHGRGGSLGPAEDHPPAKDAEDGPDTPSGPRR